MRTVAAGCQLLFLPHPVVEIDHRGQIVGIVFDSVGSRRTVEGIEVTVGVKVFRILTGLRAVIENIAVVAEDIPEFAVFERSCKFPISAHVGSRSAARSGSLGKGVERLRHGVPLDLLIRAVVAKELFRIHIAVVGHGVLNHANGHLQTLLQAAAGIKVHSSAQIFLEGVHTRSVEKKRIALRDLI